MNNSKNTFWFWAWLVLGTYKIDKKRKNPKCLIWKNLIIVSGKDAKDAYVKATQIGQADESKPDDSVKLDGKLAVTRFFGIADMGVIHDPLEDGCELYFRESRSLLSKAKKVVHPKGKIIKALEKELSPYIRTNWNPHEKTELELCTPTNGTPGAK